MAKEQWKKVGVIGSIIGLLIIVAGIVWAGGGRVTGVEKDIEKVEENATEDRQAIENVSVLVADVKKDVDANYRELKQDANDARLRDERQATQYTAILNHMERQTGHNEKAEQSISEMKTDIGKIQVQVDTLTKD